MPDEPLAIDDDTLIRRDDTLLTADVRDEIVMMKVESGRYYGLDDIGGDIWRRLETPRRFGELIDALAVDYDADRTVIADDVRKLLAQMAAHQVVTLGQSS